MIRSKISQKCASWLGFVIAFGGAGSAPAVILNLTDANSTVAIDVDSQRGLYDWKIDGINLAPASGGGINDYRQWFWYRVGNTAEQSLDTLTRSTAGTTDGNFDGFADTAFVRYLGAGYRVETTFTLGGSAANSGISDIAEQIRIINTNATPLDFHFFQYADFQLNPPAVGGELVNFVNPNTVQESGTGGIVQETVHTPVADHQLAEAFPFTINNLNDLLPTTLVDDAGAGPGDITWTYEWDVTIAPGGTFLISKDMQATIPPAPEPGTVALVSLGLFGFYLRRRSK